MGASCEKCCHRSCVNGEAGVLVIRECEKCYKGIYLCSNDLTQEELEERCNGVACGCGDDDDNLLCEDCEEDC